MGFTNTKNAVIPEYKNNWNPNGQKQNYTNYFSPRFIETILISSPATTWHRESIKINNYSKLSNGYIYRIINITVCSNRKYIKQNECFEWLVYWVYKNICGCGKCNRNGNRTGPIRNYLHWRWKRFVAKVKVLF